MKHIVVGNGPCFYPIACLSIRLSLFLGLNREKGGTRRTGRVRSARSCVCVYEYARCSKQRIFELSASNSSIEIHSHISHVHSHDSSRCIYTIIHGTHTRTLTHTLTHSHNTPTHELNPAPAVDEPPLDVYITTIAQTTLSRRR